MLAITIDAINIPSLCYPVAQRIQVVYEPPRPSCLYGHGKGVYISNTSITAVVAQTAPSPKIVRDVVAEGFKPRTELGRRLLALRRNYVANGGPLLDADAFDREMRRRRGGVSDE